MLAEIRTVVGGKRLGRCRTSRAREVHSQLYTDSTKAMQFLRERQEGEDTRNEREGGQEEGQEKPFSI